MIDIYIRSIFLSASKIPIYDHGQSFSEYFLFYHPVKYEEIICQKILQKVLIGSNGRQFYNF